MVYWTDNVLRKGLGPYGKRRMDILKAQEYFNEDDIEGRTMKINQKSRASSFKEWLEVLEND